MKYRRLTQSLNDRGTLVPSNEDTYSFIKNPEKDYYLSTFEYTEEHKNIFLETGTIAGITDLTTQKLWWDFDNEFEPEIAKKDTVILIDRLNKNGISSKDIIITYSGNKGFGVELSVNQELTPKKVKEIAFQLAGDLSTFDVKMYNASRILRMTGTKHPKTGLYKIPLSHSTLINENMDYILSAAKSSPEDNPNEFRWNTVDIPKSILGNTKESTKELITKHEIDIFSSKYLDYSAKPKFLTNCRWAIQNGHFKAGERSTALLCLASTYKNLGFDLEHVYRLLKGTAELQSKVHNSDRFSDEEIYNNMVVQVFSPSWKNGQYTCREKGNWLETFCSGLDHPCNHKEEDDLKPKTFLDLKDDFKHYVKNIDKNTISTGLPSLDNHIFLSTGANVVIVGAAGSGKTSIGLELLENTSRSGIKSVVASLDMAKNRIFEKVMYRITGKNRKELYELFQQDKETDVLKELNECYSNVNFFKKSSASVSDIKDYVIKCNEQGGEKVKLVVIDYFERISNEIGDDTAASKRVAGELQDLVDDLDICLITLMQPNKNALFSGPDSPIYDYTKIKGSSFVYQSPRIILSCWRPFYNPKDFSNDKFMKMAVLKNDLGELAECSFNWEGKRGKITEMEDFQQEEFEQMLRAKENSSKKDNSELNF